MNFNMQGMEKTIPEVYSMLKSAEVEIKKEHQVLMVNKTTKTKKGKGKKNLKKDDKGVATPGKPVAGKKPKHGPKPETECFYCKETVTGSGTAPSTQRIRRPAIPKVYVIYMLLMCT